MKSTNLGSDANMFVDFVLESPRGGPSRRLQFDVFRRKLVRQTKTRREHVDILHKGLEYRLSVALEATEPLPVEELSALSLQRVQSLRVKFRRSWKFEFMRVDLTKVFALDSHKQGFAPFMRLLHKYTGLGREQEAPGPLVEAEQTGNGFVLGLARDFKSEFISRALSLLDRLGVSETRHLETEVFEPEFLERQLKRDVRVFNHLIGSLTRGFHSHRGNGAVPFAAEQALSAGPGLRLAFPRQNLQVPRLRALLLLRVEDLQAKRL